MILFCFQIITASCERSLRILCFSSNLSRELDAVVKDHDSPAINSLIRASNDFCFAKCMTEEI